jgi:hypothetical protein
LQRENHLWDAIGKKYYPLVIINAKLPNFEDNPEIKSGPGMKVVNPIIYPTKEFIMSKIKEELDLREYATVHAVIKDYKRDFDKSDPFAAGEEISLEDVTNKYLSNPELCFLPFWTDQQRTEIPDWESLNLPESQNPSNDGNKIKLVKNVDGSNGNDVNNSDKLGEFANRSQLSNSSLSDLELFEKGEWEKDDEEEMKAEEERLRKEREGDDEEEDQLSDNTGEDE